eukprot:UN27887
MSDLRGKEEFKHSDSAFLPISTSSRRVNQLDAMLLDHELNSSLKAQFVRIFKYLPIDFVLRYDVEVSFLIQSLIFIFLYIKVVDLMEIDCKISSFTRSCHHEPNCYILLFR